MTEKRADDSDRERIERIRLYLKSATAGAWRHGRSVGRTLYADDILIGMVDRNEDAVFIANARADVPWLLNQVMLERAKRDTAERRAKESREGNSERGRAERAEARLARLRDAVVVAMNAIDRAAEGGDSRGEILGSLLFDLQQALKASAAEATE